jgi:GTP cyclohydrolase II
MSMPASPLLQNPLGTPRTRAVHRAIADARRGVPVVLAARKPLIIAPAATVGAEGLRLIDLLSQGAAALLLAPSRAAAVLQHDVPETAPAIALSLARPLIDTATLKRAADPTMEQILPSFTMTEAPEEAPAALALAKLARLLPPWWPHRCAPAGPAGGKGRIF